LAISEGAEKISVDKLLERLSASKEGLSSSEVEKRLQSYGPNELPEKRVNPALRFLSFFWGQFRG
jgi:H+-transporting ATPase